MNPIPKRIEMMDDDMAAIIDRKSPAERLAISHAMWRMARDLIKASVIQFHPEYTAEQVKQAVVRRMSHGAV